uniref:Uncharacterized protein n=1 Tax=Macrostomum lignano TaxID=282301 RepID=A0A1I8FBX7_9PLAT
MSCSRCQSANRPSGISVDLRRTAASGLLCPFCPRQNLLRSAGSIMMPGGQAAQNRSPQQPLETSHRSSRSHRKQFAVIPMLPSQPEPARAELLKYLACLEGEVSRPETLPLTACVSRDRSSCCSRLAMVATAWPIRGIARINSTPGLVTSFGAFCESDIDEAALKSMYDSELAALENLIDMQSRAQQRMREQINQVERRYRRLEFERQQSRKLDREVARSVSQALADERAPIGSARAWALSLIRDRRALTSRLSALQSRCQQLERESRRCRKAAAAAELEAAALANRVDAEQRRARDLAAEPGGLLKVKPEPPVRRNARPDCDSGGGGFLDEQQQPAGAKSSTKHSQQQA